MIGYCCLTSWAASRPICTSCSGVYLFFGGVILVCAATVLAASVKTIAMRLSSFMSLRPHLVPFKKRAAGDCPQIEPCVHTNGRDRPYYAPGRPAHRYLAGTVLAL